MISIQSFDGELYAMAANRVAIIAKLVICFIAGMESALMIFRIFAR
jgi:hypothetical protein